MKKEPRIDTRKEAIKNDIRKALLASKSYVEFEKQMKQMNYEVIKGRGIAFIDSKKVYVKGSEVGYSLSIIEKILATTDLQKMRLIQRQIAEEKAVKKSKPIKQKEPPKNIAKEFRQDFSKAVEILLRTEETFNQTPYELINKKRKKKHQRSHHL
ncbi:hypothetical protein [Sediminibacterium sp.]|uniref:hypothetical protein n=1 Tax=Sediminibacterium sp. TaxID=1917865 RepID=UPI0025FE5A96|nr:hypothetical protein [Sediminibacterium sp.]MBT9485649.1 hypothetical protein [Sediminibacterium sp.]